MIDPDDIWNRAAEGAGKDARAGDHALADVLLMHGMVENGGVLHAVEGLEPEELEAAIRGYTWLGLEPVAELAARVRSEVGAGALDEDRAEALEESSNDEYATLVPDDDTLDEAFRRRLTERPDDFAPLRTPRGRWGRLLGR